MSGILLPGQEAEYVPNPDGYIVVGGQEIANTLQCCHCGQHWIAVKGSGKVRGYCTRCRQVTCGDHKCMECIPYEAKMEFEEGKTNDFTTAIKDNIAKFGSLY